MVIDLNLKDVTNTCQIYEAKSNCRKVIWRMGAHELPNQKKSVTMLGIEKSWIKYGLALSNDIEKQ